MKRAIVKGVLAGLAGTAVMTVAQRLEISVTGRRPSTVPGQVAAQLLGHSEPDIAARLNVPTHWAHGAAMGPLRGALAAMGLRGVTGSAVFFAMMWASDAMLYRALGIADRPWHWSRTELATDIGHKALYALVTGIAYDTVAGRRRARR
ncbi:MAG: hypothetical protein M3228_05255 [Actinomycetota bacterium]|nr:hypothetical protein [Actinomycetota bacterium]